MIVLPGQREKSRTEDETLKESAGNERKPMTDEEDKSVHKEISHNNVEENDVATDSYVEKES